MTPTKQQIRWVGKYLKSVRQKVLKVIDFIPRAYCVAKPAPGCAVMLTPPMDFRKHLRKPGLAQFYQGELLQFTGTGGLDSINIKLGDWVSMAYCSDNIGTYMVWYWVPAIPIEQAGGSSGE